MPAPGLHQASSGSYWWTRQVSASQGAEESLNPPSTRSVESNEKFRELLSGLAAEHHVLQKDRDALAEENAFLRSTLAEKADEKFLGPPSELRSEHKGPQQQVKFMQVPRLFAWEQAVIHTLTDIKARLGSVERFVANQRSRRPDQTLQSGSALTDLVEALSLVLTGLFVAVCDHPERDGKTDKCLMCDDAGFEAKRRLSSIPSSGTPLASISEQSNFNAATDQGASTHLEILQTTENIPSILLRNTQQAASTLAAENEALRVEIDRLGACAGAALGVPMMQALSHSASSETLSRSLSRKSSNLSPRSSLRISSVATDGKGPLAIAASTTDASAARQPSVRISGSGSSATASWQSENSTSSTLAPLPSFGALTGSTSQHPWLRPGVLTSGWSAVSQMRSSPPNDSEVVDTPPVALGRKSSADAEQAKRMLNRSLSRQMSKMQLDKQDGDVRIQIPDGMSRRISGASDYGVRGPQRARDVSKTSKFSGGSSIGIQGFMGHRKTKKLELRRTVTTVMTQAPDDGELKSDDCTCLVRFVILPSSWKRNLWDLIGSILIMIDIVLIPMSVFDMTGTTFESFSHQLELFTTLYWTSDVPRQFFQGYHVEGLVELRLPFIARRYVKSWLLPDLCVVLIDWFFILTYGGGGVVSYSRSGKVLRGMRVVRGIRLIRIAKMPTVLRLVMLDKIRGPTTRTIIFLVWFSLGVFLLAHWTACYWYAMTEWTTDRKNWVKANRVDPTDIGYIYVLAIEWSLARLGMASTQVYATNVGERLYSGVVIFVGIVLCSMIVSSMTCRMMQYMLSNQAMFTEQNNLRRFLTENNVSTDLSDCIWQWFRQKYQERQRRVQDNDIKFLSDLPLLLQMVLRKEVYSPILTGHPFLKAYSWKHSRRISLICNFAVSQRHCVAEEEVFVYEQKAEMMYFVSSGDLEYYFGGKRLSAIMQENFRRAGIADIGKSIKASVTEIAEDRGVKAEPIFAEDQENKCISVWTGGILCEAAVWLRCKHTGTCLAETSATLVQLSPEKLHMVLKEFGPNAKPFLVYASMFCERVCKPGIDLEEYSKIDSLSVQGIAAHLQGSSIRLRSCADNLKYLTDIPDLAPISDEELNKIAQEAQIMDAPLDDEEEMTHYQSGEIDLTRMSAEDPLGRRTSLAGSISSGISSFMARASKASSTSSRPPDHRASA